MERRIALVANRVAVGLPCREPWLLDVLRQMGTAENIAGLVTEVLPAASVGEPMAAEAAGSSTAR